MKLLTRSALPSPVWLMISMVVFIAIWMVTLELGFKSINLLSDLTPMTTRLRWGLIPPVFLAALLFLAQWSIGGLRVQAAELMQQQQAQQQADA